MPSICRRSVLWATELRGIGNLQRIFHDLQQRVFHYHVLIINLGRVMLAYGSHNHAEETDSQRGYDAAEDAEGMTPLAGEQGKNHKHALQNDDEDA